MSAFNQSYAERCQVLADMITVAQEAHCVVRGYTKMDIIKADCQARVIHGKKYTKIDVGTSGKYMIVPETGVIHGIKAYGVIHPKHTYGTLDTIAQWNWGGYVAIKL